MIANRLRRLKWEILRDSYFEPKVTRRIVCLYTLLLTKTFAICIHRGVRVVLWKFFLERLDLEYLRTHYREVEIPNASNRMIHGCTIFSNDQGWLYSTREGSGSPCASSLSLFFFLFSFLRCSSRISHDSLRPLACEYRHPIVLTLSNRRRVI